ncbi:hypothetical protein [Synechocystis sp. PCC 7509]|uniref:hypothetical protein n=1 Tax=Synechocystis sp. PCC 7509 TaxID=927677 RepID=UPI0002AD1584|nr:hypothetical protein [Synechocystis sp. PCC 7509]
MPLSLSLGSLSSRSVRSSSVAGGVRRIATTGTAEQGNLEGLAAVWDITKKFGTSLMSLAFNAIKALISFDFKKLWGQIISGALFIWNFDWNITDAAIDAQIQQAEIALAASKGTLAGQSLGFGVCGLAPAATIAVFNQPLALYMMKELGEEAADEIAASLANLVSLQIQQVARVGFFTLFRNHRSLFRGAARVFAQAMVLAGQFDQASVDKMNKKRNEPWTFSNAKDEQIEGIKDPVGRAYWENFWEEFQESCIEAGFIVAGAADGFFAAQKMSNESVFGTERIIEIEPNRSEDEATP